MAVPQVSTVTTATGGGGPTVIGGHTVGTGLTDSLLVAMIQSPSYSEVDSCTWNGTAMTPLEFTSLQFWSSCFYIFAPETGLHNCVANYVTYPAKVGMTMITFTGAKDISSASHASATSSAALVTVTTPSDDSLIVDFCMSVEGTHTQDGGQAERSNYSAGSSPPYKMSTSTLAKATAGAQDMSVTLGTSGIWQINGFSVDSVVGPGDFIPQTIII